MDKREKIKGILRDFLVQREDIIEIENPIIASTAYSELGDRTVDEILAVIDEDEPQMVIIENINY